jgi:hypothetical protein
VALRAAERCFRVTGEDCDGDDDSAGVNIFARPLVLSRTGCTLTRNASNDALTRIEHNGYSLVELFVQNDNITVPAEDPVLAITFSNDADCVDIFIEPGTYDGQILFLRNCHTSIIQINAGVGGSGVRLISNTDKAIGVNDTMMMIWNATESTWDQMDAIAALP